jgi:hypothetical protein
MVTKQWHENYTRKPYEYNFIQHAACESSVTSKRVIIITTNLLQMTKNVMEIFGNKRLKVAQLFPELGEIFVGVHRYKLHRRFTLLPLRYRYVPNR